MSLRRIASIVAIGVLGVLTAAVIFTRPPADPATPAVPSARMSTDATSFPGLTSPGDPGEADGSETVTHVRYDVVVTAGSYRILTVDVQGEVTGEREIAFDRGSMAPVDRVEAASGLVHWRTVVGGLAGWSWVAEQSGPFTVRETVQLTDGSQMTREIDPEG